MTDIWWWWWWWWWCNNKIYLAFHLSSPKFLTDFNQVRISSTDLRRNLQYWISRKSCQRVMLWFIWTDGMADMPEKIDSSCDCANLPIEIRSRYLSIIYVYHVPCCYSPASHRVGLSFIPGKSMWGTCWTIGMGIQTNSFSLFSIT